MSTIEVSLSKVKFFVIFPNILSLMEYHDQKHNDYSPLEAMPFGFSEIKSL